MLHRNLSFSLLLALAVFVLGFAVRLAPVKASFPGANGKIAFSRFTLGGPNQGIFTMNSDGSMQTNLTNPPNADQLPAWSPNGAKLAFGRSGGIYVMNSDGTGVTQLTGDGDNSPTWSPDGTTIAFLSVRAGTPDIYVMNSDGTGVTRLTANLGQPVFPSWSPDGTRIAFNSQFEGEIYIMNPDGSQQTNVTNNPAFDRFPDWAPDGNKIAFERNNEIWVMNSDGSGQTRVSNISSLDTDRQPAWSPTARKSHSLEREHQTPAGTVVNGLVSRGNPIATIGSLRTFSPHLHFEMRTSFNPRDWYPQDDGCGYYDSLNQILSLGFIDPVIH